ncbi:MAG TPA: 5'-nucleotidase C-terminal domain-containing protein [Thermoanaerobaculia bacterium]|nr:5'-nucleotidase C-terminal domain-containing protein [Thermoanaerobaculia bacterium]
MKRLLVLFAILLASCATAPVVHPPVHVVVVGTTDVHGWFAGHAQNNTLQYGGVALLSSYVKALRAEPDSAVVLVDSGDLFQGTLESNYFEGEPVVRAYNDLGYAAAAVGNHEFDYGPVGPDSVARVPGEDPLGALKKNAASAKFPFLSANMTEKATGQTPAWAKRYTMIDAGGARIGIIGLSTPDTPNVTLRANVLTLDFGDPVAATVAAARELRAQGADAIVVIAHMGGRCTDVNDVHDVASCDPDQEAVQFVQHLPAGTIDAYFAGHTHQQMREFFNGVPVVQGLAYGRQFSTVDLYVDRDHHHVDAMRTAIRPLTDIVPTASTQPDPQLRAVLQPYLERVAAKRNEDVGITAAAPFRRGFGEESPLGDLLADALRAAAKSDMAFMNSGGIRTNLRAGKLVYGDLFEVSPFDNYLAVVGMTGAQIAEALRLTTNGERGIMQVSGLRYTYDAAKDRDKPANDRSRLVSVTLPDGTPLDPAKVYTVAMPDFLATGGDGLLPVTSAIPADRIRFDQVEPLHDVFADVLRSFPQPLVPKTDGRITVLNPTRGGDSE